MRNGIIIPSIPERRPRPSGKRMSLCMGFAAVLDPDGSVAWQEDEWTLNGLHDAGEQSMLNVYLKEQANPTKYLALLNQSIGTILETNGTMAAVTETQTPTANGYNRVAVAAGDWTDDGLQSGDYRFSAAEKTFGPATATWTITAAALTTTLTSTAGLLLATLALSATTTIASTQSFKYILRVSLS